MNEDFYVQYGKYNSIVVIVGYNNISAACFLFIQDFGSFPILQKRNTS